ncbi:hypothetical protein FRC07_011455, partial [Ceratobasidium sp. 392]
MLTRRRASVEATISLEEWDRSVSIALNDLSRLPIQEAKPEHLMLKVCALLDPESPEPTRPMLSVLQDNLGPQSCAYSSVIGALDESLWLSSYKPILYGSLQDATSFCATALINDSGNCGASLRDIEKMDLEALCCEPLEDNCLENLGIHFMRTCFNDLFEAYGRLRRSMNIDQHLSLRKRLTAGLFSRLGAFSLSRLLKDVTGCTTASLSEFVRTQIVDIFGGDAGYDQLWEEAIDMIQETTLMPAIMEALSQAEAQRDILHPQATALQNHITLILKTIFMIRPLEAYLRTLAAAATAPSLDKAVRSRLPHIQVQVVHPVSSSITTAIEFQEEYILQRIKDHAQRVDGYRLGDIFLVRMPIETTMAEVWNLLPEGFKSLPPAVRSGSPFGGSVHPVDSPLQRAPSFIPPSLE